MKPNKQIVVNDILLEMELGISYTECLGVNKAKWGVAPTTFDRYWKEAQNKFKELLDERERLKQEAFVKFEQEALERKILTKLERQEILSQIGRGEIRVKKEVATKLGIEILDVEPDFADRRAAIAELNKMDGDYAPVKKDITSGGEKITRIDFID